MTVLELFKFLFTQTPKVLMGIVLSCIVFLLIGANLSDTIVWGGRVKEYFFVGWVALIISSCLLLSYELFEIVPKIAKRRRLINILPLLSKKQKETLRSYIDKNTTTQRLHLDGESEFLVDVGFLYHAVEITNKEMGTHRFDYNIEPDVLAFLKKHHKKMNQE